MLVGTRTASPRPGAEGFAPVHARVNLTSPVRTASIGGHGMAWDRTRYRSRSIAGVCAIPLVLLAFGAVAAEAATTRPRPADPVRVSSAAADSLRAAYAHDRAGTEKNLKEGATSYLAAVARTDFDERTALVVGRAADCDLHVDDPALAAHHLRVSVVGDSFRVEALDAGAKFRVGQGDERCWRAGSTGASRAGRSGSRHTVCSSRAWTSGA